MSLRAAGLPYRQQVKQDAVGEVVLRTDQPLTSATFTVWWGGSQVATSAAATIVTVSGGAEARCATSAGFALGLDYEARIAPDVGPERVVLFDVVRSPLGPLVSYDELLSLRPTEVRYIASASDALGLTPDLFVESLAARARAKLQDKIRGLLPPQIDLDRALPMAVLDVDGLTRVERALCAAELFASRMQGQDADGGDDRDSVLWKHYTSEAEATLRALGRVRIDIDDDGQADSRSRWGTVQMVRRQG